MSVKPSRSRRETDGSPYQRKKQPAVVRQQLLAIAGSLLAERGERALTLDAVARSAGVSKGGLLHHFPSRNDLLEGLFEDLMGRFEERLLEFMANDKVEHGRFCRAYLNTIVSLSPTEETDSVALLSLAIQKEFDLKTRLSQWTVDRLEAHSQTDSFPEAHLVRYAADGLWLSVIIDGHGAYPEAREQVYRRLLELTYPR